MPPPKDLWQAFRGDDFRFRSWEDAVGNERCFHLSGFTDILQLLGLDIRRHFEGTKAKIPTAKLAREAVRRVEQEYPQWREAFGKDDERQQNEWKQFGAEQVMNCYRRRPMLLQKAVMSLVFLDLAVKCISEKRQKAGKPAISVDVFDLLKIDAAVYFVKGFDKSFFNRYLNTASTGGKVKESIRNETIRRLKDATGQENTVVFDEITRDGATCLYDTAAGVIKAFRQEHHITSLKPECGNFTHRPPSKHEVAAFKTPLTPELREALAG
ncbi:MAG: hypothetical protein QOJ84_745 [Bradyrhizobium sp.]|jgi:hypothetical protein|nr:hypothetical protein [Bradyrhizobium sp.]